MRSCLSALLALATAASASVQVQSREAAALANYRRVMNGQVRLGDLEAQERADVAEVDRRAHGRPLDRRSLAQRCYDAELKDLGRSPSELALRSAATKCGLRYDSVR